MHEKIIRTKIKKLGGYLYFVDKKGDISRAKMARGTTKGGKSEKVRKIGLKKEKGYLYYLDKRGDISRAKMISSPGTKGTDSGGPRKGRE